MARVVVLCEHPGCNDPVYPDYTKLPGPLCWTHFLRSRIERMAGDPALALSDGPSFDRGDLAATLDLLELEALQKRVGA